MALNAKIQAWRDLRMLAQTLKGILALEDELKEAGSLDKLIAASTKQLEAVNADLSKATLTLEQADKRGLQVIATAESRAAELITLAQNRAKAIIDEERKTQEKDAKARLDNMVQGAKAKAQSEYAQIVADANGEAEKLRQQGRDIVAAAQRTSETLTSNANNDVVEAQRRVSEAAATLSQTLKQVENARKEHDDLVTEISKLKKRFA